MNFDWVSDFRDYLERFYYNALFKIIRCCEFVIKRLSHDSKLADCLA
jgi:two-component SAPR family response regulator